MPDIKKFNVSASVTGTLDLIIEAENEDQAIEKFKKTTNQLNFGYLEPISWEKFKFDLHWSEPKPTEEQHD